MSHLIRRLRAEGHPLMVEAADEIERLEKANVELERLCDTTYVAQGADAYNYACELMEPWQEERFKQGKEIGTEGSLCDGLEWLYHRLDELEALTKGA